MCGIFGVLNFDSSRLEAAREALHTLTHRGPDQWGEHHTGQIYFGHRRLSIRDLSENGRQPFVDRETGVAVLVNGEIWNDKALRAELGEARFRGHSDCEVLLHGYLTWGLETLLQRLDGFFGAAIFDPRSGQLHLLKDRFGKKPLYYARHGQQWIFASEAKALLAYEPALRVFSLDGILHWMSFRGSMRPETIFRGVRKVSAGCALTIDQQGQANEHRYFDFVADVAAAYPQAPMDEASLDQRIEGLLGKAIEKRFLSDVPVGLQLSGGVDSSLLAVLTHEVHGGSLDTYTVTFPAQGDQAFNEADYAQAVARHCGFRHHEVPVDQQKIADAFPQVVQLFDGMLDIPNAIPIYLLAQQAKHEISVVLTGEGADELFGGYGKFSWAPGLAAQSPGWTRWLPEMLFDAALPHSGLQHRLTDIYRRKHYAGQPQKLLAELNCFITPDTLSHLARPFPRDALAGLNPAIAQLPYAKQLQLVDQLTYLNFLLERQDKASMGAAMEARLPFLDLDLITAISTLPSDLLYTPGQLKKPLKRLLAKRMGDDFTYRSKAGFALPIAQWLQDPEGLGRYVDAALHPDFLLWQQVDRKRILDYLHGSSFSLRQVSYGDDERHWLRWFLAVIAAAQEAFAIERLE